jgi:Amt family ammonium transporter
MIVHLTGTLGAAVAVTFLEVRLVKYGNSGKFNAIRVSSEEEIAGLDFAEHGSSAYEFHESFVATGAGNFHPEFGVGLIDPLNNVGKASNQPHITNVNETI